MSDPTFTISDLLRECVNGMQRVVLLELVKQALIRRNDFQQAAQVRDEALKIYHLVEEAGEELTDWPASKLPHDFYESPDKA